MIESAGYYPSMRHALITASLFLLAACTSNLQYHDLDASRPAWLADSHTISDVPFFPQDRYQCGPAALATLLTAKGLHVTPEALRPIVYVPERKGSFQPEIMAATRANGFLAYPLAPRLLDLLSEVNAGNLVLVLQNLGLNSLPQWHYAVVKGFDLQREKLILNSGETENYEISLPTFERTWIRADRWALVAVTPGDLPATVNAQDYFSSVVAFEPLNPSNPVLADIYQTGLEEWPQDRNLLMGYGNFLLTVGQYYQAVDVFTTTMNLYPHYGPAHNNIAQALINLGQFEEAEYHVRQALAQDDEFNPTYQRTLETLRRVREQ